MFTFVAKSEQDTERLGKALASHLQPGTVVGLIGPLGAGKTRLVQAFAVAVGVPAGRVTSPTFVLVNEYSGGRTPVYHFDTYRLKDDDEFLNLGPDEYFDSAGITFVEWADKVETLLPKDRLEIAIDPVSETERRFTLRGTSPEIETLIDQVHITSSSPSTAPSARDPS
jgi:tRNA threonylcarbamoyladenosine biosynthesis protein TsaE